MGYSESTPVQIALPAFTHVRVDAKRVVEARSPRLNCDSRSQQVVHTPVDDIDAQQGDSIHALDAAPPEDNTDE